MTHGKLIGDLLAEVYPDRPHILGPWLTVANLVLLYAPRGIGKTFFGLWLAHSIATGSKFLKWTPEFARKVALFDGEMGLQPLHKRFTEIDKSAINSIRGNMLKVVSFESFPKSVMPNLSTPEGQEIYADAMKGHDIAIIDNLLTCSHPQDKRDDEVKQWTRIQEWAVGMRQQGKSIVFIHHAGKSGEQLGTSIKENIMDTVVKLVRPKVPTAVDGFEVELSFEKSRNFYGKEAEPLYVKLENSTTGFSRWSWTTLEEKKKLDILDCSEKGMSPYEIAKHMNIPVYRVKTALASTAKQHWSDGYEHDSDF